MNQKIEPATLSLLTERITELETKVSYLELGNQELSDLLYEQQQQIDKHMRQIADHLSELSTTPAEAVDSDEKPPHY